MDNILSVIILTGLLAGTLDGTAAVLQYVLLSGGSPARVFFYIASGWFGRAAFSAGKSVALWGILFHYLIAFAWTILYFVVYPKIKLLLKNTFLNGIAYGLFIWLVMNLIVLPLSNVPPSHFTTFRALMGIGILMICVGLPIAWMTARHYSRMLEVKQ
jgi:hypothetical protein